MNKTKVIMYAGVLLAIAALVSIGSASSISKNSRENTIENTIQYTVECTINNTIEGTLLNVDDEQLLVDLQNYEAIFYSEYRANGCNRIYDVNRNGVINFQDARLCWSYAIDYVNRTFYGDLLYDVNMDGNVNFQDCGLIWVNRD